MGVVIRLGRWYSNQGTNSGVEWVLTYSPSWHIIHMIQNALHHIWHRAMRESGIRYAKNRWRYGPEAPRPDERLWVNPLSVKQMYRRKDRTIQRLNNRYSGVVLAGDWDLDRLKLWRSPKYRACWRHFNKGFTWEETGIYAYSLRRIAQDGHIDRMTTLAEVKERYARIDVMMADIQKEGKLRSASPSKTHEKRGILMHIDRNGKLLFGNEGYHRLALARIAKLPIIPVRLGIVHPDALKTDVLPRLRQSSPQE